MPYLLPTDLSESDILVRNTLKSTEGVVMVEIEPT